MKIDKNIKKNIEKIKSLNGNSPDLAIRDININNTKISIAFFETVASDDKISNFLVKSVINTVSKYTFLDNLFKNVSKDLQSNLLNSNVIVLKDFQEIYYYLSSGFAILFVNGYDTCLVIEARETLDRGVGEPTTENSIRGPRDAFGENHNKNIGLIRKRIKSDTLWFDDYIIGRRTLTKVNLCYINDVVLKDNLEMVKNKIKDIDIDGIIDSGYIRNFLSNDLRTHFPTIVSTERPDSVCASLLEGKIAILVENCPFVLVVPGYLNNFLHASEDSYQNAMNATVTRFFRFLAMLLTIVLPGFYVAITTFNQEVIPDTLLTSLAVQRTGNPFPTFFSIFLLMLTFEILRESDLRIPETMGTSISVVGALVLGEAVVNAGIVSPIDVIIVATSSITGLLFNNMDLVNALRIWKFIFLLFSSFMGLIGFVAAGLLLITQLCSINVLGVSYLVPFSPLFTTALKDSLFTAPRDKIKTRPPYLTKNFIRLGGKKNEKN